MQIRHKTLPRAPTAEWDVADPGGHRYAGLSGRRKAKPLYAATKRDFSARITSSLLVQLTPEPTSLCRGLANLRMCDRLLGCKEDCHGTVNVVYKGLGCKSRICLDKVKYWRLSCTGRAGLRSNSRCL